MTKTDNRYVALIADAVASRTLAPRARAQLQSDVRASLGEINRRWRRAIAAKFAVTRGDEIEGLLGSAAAAWDIAHWIRLKFAEADWVIACGRGAITTPLAPTAPEVDGPSWRPGIRCSGTRSRPGRGRESAVRHPAVRVRARRNAVAGPDRRAPPRSRAAVRRSAVRGRRARRWQLPRAARRAAGPGAVVGARAAHRHRLSLCVRARYGADPRRAGAAAAPDAARRGPHRGSRGHRPRADHRGARAGPGADAAAAGSIRRRRLDHRCQIAGALQGPGRPGIRGILPDRHAGLAAPRPARRHRDETAAGITGWGVGSGTLRGKADLRPAPSGTTPHSPRLYGSCTQPSPRTVCQIDDRPPAPELRGRTRTDSPGPRRGRHCGTRALRRPRETGLPPRLPARRGRRPRAGLHSGDIHSLVRPVVRD